MFFKPSGIVRSSFHTVELIRVGDKTISVKQFEFSLFEESDLTVRSSFNKMELVCHPFGSKQKKSFSSSQDFSLVAQSVERSAVNR
jgi:hypothetical protein